MDDSQILKAMRSGVQYKFPVQIRGLKLNLRPLSISEETEVEAQVYDLLMDLPENKRTRLMETRLLATRSLELASTSAPDVKDMKLTQLELDSFTIDEVQYIWKQYTLGVAKVNPSLEMMPASEVIKLAEAIKKNPSTLIEQSTSVILSLAHLALTLADKPQDN